jgi:excisionase family DNA binding protein
MSNIITRKASEDATETPLKLLKLDQAAECLAMGKRTLQDLMAAGEIGFLKIGKSVRFHPDDLEAFIERHRIKAYGWKGA